MIKQTQNVRELLKVQVVSIERQLQSQTRPLSISIERQIAQTNFSTERQEIRANARQSLNVPMVCKRKKKRKGTRGNATFRNL